MMGHFYSSLYQSNLCTLHFPYSTTILQLKKCPSSTLDMGSWSSFFSNVLSLKLVLLCSDIVSLHFGIYCSHDWLTFRASSWPFRIYLQSKSFEVVNTDCQELGYSLQWLSEQFQQLSCCAIDRPSPVVICDRVPGCCNFLVVSWSRTPVVICDLWQVGI